MAASALATDQGAATAVARALRDAQKWASAHDDEAATRTATPDNALTPALIRDMLNNEPPLRPVLGHTLREQMAQYCDELQLIGLLPSTESAAHLAHSYTQNVLKG